MARQKLYGNRKQTGCEVCEFGKLTADGEAVLCAAHGVVPPYHHCRRFRYDPLKRIPQRTNPLPAFSQEDFALEEPVPGGVPEEETTSPDESLPPASPPAQGASEEILSPDTARRAADYLSGESPTLSGLLGIVCPGAAGAGETITADDTDDILGDLERLFPDEAVTGEPDPPEDESAPDTAPPEDASPRQDAGAAKAPDPAGEPPQGGTEEEPPQSPPPEPS